MSIEKYTSAQVTTETPRQSEYRLFADVTRELIAQRTSGRPETAFFAAVDRNRRMWVTLQMDVASPDNDLADDLKAQLISLAIWVDKHSSKVLHGDGSVEPLIAVNRSIMEGLVPAR